MTDRKNLCAPPVPRIIGWCWRQAYNRGKSGALPDPPGRLARGLLFPFSMAQSPGSTEFRSIDRSITTVYDLMTVSRDSLGNLLRKFYRLYGIAGEGPPSDLDVSELIGDSSDDDMTSLDLDLDLLTQMVEDLGSERR